jgi:hypothetical protein
MRRKTKWILWAAAALSAVPVVLAQQTNVTRFDAYAGYAFLDSPAIGLFENGFQLQAGVRPNTVVSLGFDYSRSTGNLTLTPNLLTTALQAELGAQLAGLVHAGVIPPNYTLVVPADSVTQEFAAGPQFHYRHFKHLTLFLRPSIGAIHERATPKPGDPIATAIAQQLAPGGYKADWARFYGFGYGFDVLLTNHLAIRTQGDLVHDHLFSDLLQNGRWTVRFSIGPAFNFGPNIVHRR